MKHLTDANRSLTALIPSEGVAFMLELYRQERAEECHTDGGGDMLLFQWGTYDWGEGAAFELDITRQLIVGDGEDEDIFQLSLTFKFEPTAALRQLGAGNRWCHSPEELDGFREFIYGSPAFLAVRREVPSDVDLEYGCAG